MIHINYQTKLIQLYSPCSCMPTGSCTADPALDFGSASATAPRTRRTSPPAAGLAHASHRVKHSAWIVSLSCAARQQRRLRQDNAISSRHNGQAAPSRVCPDNAAQVLIGASWPWWRWRPPGRATTGETCVF
jgi:hypothetical protein